MPALTSDLRPGLTGPHPGFCNRLALDPDRSVSLRLHFLLCQMQGRADDVATPSGTVKESAVPGCFQVSWVHTAVSPLCSWAFLITIMQLLEHSCPEDLSPLPLPVK